MTLTQRQIQQIHEVATGANLPPLSNRELQILSGIAHGENTKSIAQKLFLGVRTIDTHRENIKRKLQADSMPHAVAIALSRKLIEFPQDKAG